MFELIQQKIGLKPRFSLRVGSDAVRPNKEVGITTGLASGEEVGVSLLRGNHVDRLLIK